jgi:uncharacterized iron-regulated membrane protein
MTQTGIRRWYLIHKWTSLACTLFMLMLCITGLPLIFDEEIDALTATPLAQKTAPATPPTLDAIVASARADHRGEVMMFLSRDDEEPIYYVSTAPRADETDTKRIHLDQYDARTGEKLARPPTNSGVLFFLLRLHQSMLLGLPGELFLGLMGLLLVVSLVSGTVVYAPFMRKLRFGTVRKDRSRRVRWLDTHNMIGIVTLAWLAVVGLTGVINTLATPIQMLWQRDQLAEMTAHYTNAPPLRRLSSVDAAVATAQKAAPGMTVAFIAFPGTSFSSRHHYGVFMRGTTPLTERLVKPALIDAETGALTDMRELPWYAKALFLSQPLHFGNYGGLPLKIIWALLDIAAIAVLGTGVYLWLGRRRVPIEKRLAELSSGALLEVQR